MNEEFPRPGAPEPNLHTPPAGDPIPAVPPVPPVAPPPPLPQVPIAPPRGYVAPAYPPVQSPYPPRQYTPAQPYGQQPPYTPPQGYAPPYYTAPPQYPYPPQPVRRTNGLAVASMVLGIVSIVFFYALFFSVIMGGMALIFGICSRKGDDKMSGMAVAGIVCGSIGLVLGLLMIIAMAKGVTDIALSFEEGNALSCFPFIH